MKVEYNYLDKEFKNLFLIEKKWKNLIKTSDFTLGKYVKKFEEKICNYLGVKYCISVNNGTDALILCLKALGIKNGDEVITVCNTFYATAGAIVAVGATPVFVDSDDRFQLSIKQIEKKITKKTKAIIPVHWAGGSPEIEKVLKIAKKYNIQVIEDACMGIGSKLGNKFAGTFGKVNAISMHPLKSLNVMGDGGAVLTNDKKLFKWLKIYRNHGMINRNEIVLWGENKRMQPLQCIVATEGLKKLKNVIKKRNKNAAYLDKYLSEIGSRVTLPKRIEKNIENYSLYMGLFDKRDELLKYLVSKNIEAKIHYPIPLHLQKASMHLKYRKGDFPNAELQAKKLMTLPVHQYLNTKQLNYMIKLIKRFYDKN
jgi:aminotransferase EvaB